MNTKSSIQRTIEYENMKSRFKNTLTRLVESYDIKGNVFAIDTNWNPVEVSNGYFVEEKTYDNLNDCIKDMVLGQAVSIREDKYILGIVKRHLSECESNTPVLDIQYLQYVR